jgi:diguanylate cyclase (GGDEF)-like protein
MGLKLLPVLTALVLGRLRSSLFDATGTDRLTGLLNRPAFEEQVELELERCRRAGRELSVIVAHVDGAGDKALQLAARDIMKWKRRTDSAARVGAAELGLLVPESDERGAFLVAERLRRAAQRTFTEESLDVTISFGVATFPHHGQDPDLLMAAASSALLAALSHSPAPT